VDVFICAVLEYWQWVCASSVSSSFDSQGKFGLRCGLHFGLITGKASHDISLPATTSAKAFFSDVSWTSVPSDRKSPMVHVPSVPKLGLFGGSSKPSKLAALAASRKKQNEEKKKAEQQAQAADAERALSLLDRLASKKDGVSGTERATSNISDKSRLSAVFRPKSNTLSEPAIEEAEDDQEEPIPEEPSGPVFKAEPSIFARALCGVNEKQETEGASLIPTTSKQPSDLTFGLPYVRSNKYINADPFANPSPDDVVLAAQSKGFLHS
jgi:elongation factor 1 alpha-like protein